jgi:NADH dehydrogenase/NADH:ubiquinone oxidoreductase subunit G
MATITLDGTAKEAPETMTVLQVARLAGVDIPTLCHHESLGPYGACRLCVVEAESPTLRRSLITACTLQVADGLSVVTNSAAVQRARKIVLELLLARSPNSRPLRALAKQHGVEGSRFGAGLDDDDLCVRCGLCVRACTDQIGAAAISFAGRGQKREVSTEFGHLSRLCIGCGTCAAVCPTGAIQIEDNNGERSILLRGRAFARLALIRCSSCGISFAAERHLDKVSHRLPESPQAEMLSLCPACSRQHYAAAMASEIPQAGKGF